MGKRRTGGDNPRARCPMMYKERGHIASRMPHVLRYRAGPRAGVVRADDLTCGVEIIEDLIADGDVVLVRRQDTADDGDTVVALLLNGPSAAGEATLKRFYHEPD